MAIQTSDTRLSERKRDRRPTTLAMIGSSALHSRTRRVSIYISYLTLVLAFSCSLKTKFAHSLADLWPRFVPLSYCTSEKEQEARASQLGGLIVRSSTLKPSAGGWGFSLRVRNSTEIDSNRNTFGRVTPPCIYSRRNKILLYHLTITVTNNNQILTHSQMYKTEPNIHDEIGMVVVVCTKITSRQVQWSPGSWVYGWSKIRKIEIPLRSVQFYSLVHLSQRIDFTTTKSYIAN